MQTYSEKLRDPRWQKRRLEILKRDEFACRSCGDDTTELQVHHRYYMRGFDPWEYGDDALLTLCKTCHKSITELKSKLGYNIHFEPQFSALRDVLDLLETEHFSTISLIVLLLKKHPERLDPTLKSLRRWASNHKERK